MWTECVASLAKASLHPEVVRNLGSCSQSVGGERASITRSCERDGPADWRAANGKEGFAHYFRPQRREAVSCAQVWPLALLAPTRLAYAVVATTMRLTPRTRVSIVPLALARLPVAGYLPREERLRLEAWHMQLTQSAEDAVLEVHGPNWPNAAVDRRAWLSNEAAKPRPSGVPSAAAALVAVAALGGLVRSHPSSSGFCSLSGRAPLRASAPLARCFPPLGGTPCFQCPDPGLAAAHRSQNQQPKQHHEPAPAHRKTGPSRPPPPPPRRSGAPRLQSSCRIGSGICLERRRRAAPTARGFGVTALSASSQRPAVPADAAPLALNPQCLFPHFLS